MEKRYLKNVILKKFIFKQEFQNKDSLLNQIENHPVFENKTFASF